MLNLDFCFSAFYLLIGETFSLVERLIVISLEVNVHQEKDRVLLSRHSLFYKPLEPSMQPSAFCCGSASWRQLLAGLSVCVLGRKA